MLYLVGIFVLISISGATNDCPEELLRLSSHHSYCLPPNGKCEILYTGVTDDDKQVILDTHNQLRNQIAVGEDNSNGLPTASDMIQMEWDNNLAAIAQKYALQCKFEHDCGACRSVADFPVGQNLGQWPANCITDNCAGAKDDENKKPEWKVIITNFYNERKFVNPPIIKSYVFGMDYGHFSQLAWSTTWKVGCGYSVYLDGKRSLSRLFVCNYGPTGNYLNKPIYQSGAPCSSCPLDSTCGASYPGLCKLQDPNKAPRWKENENSGKNIIYDCDFTQNSKCAYNIEGKTDWKTYSRVFGPTTLVVLNGGESTTMNFLETIKPKEKFCLAFVLRRGPNVGGQQEAGSLKANIKMGNSDPWIVDVGVTTTDFMTYNYPCWKQDTTFSLSYAVPSNAPPQYLELRRVFAYLGECQD